MSVSLVCGLLCSSSLWAYVSCSGWHGSQGVSGRVCILPRSLVLSHHESVPKVYSLWRLRRPFHVRPSVANSRKPILLFFFLGFRFQQLQCWAYLLCGAVFTSEIWCCAAATFDTISWNKDAVCTFYTSSLGRSEVDALHILCFCQCIWQPRNTLA